MNMTNEEYGEFINRLSPPSPVWGNMLRAFLVGGLICCAGEGLTQLFTELCFMSERAAGTWTSITLVLLGALLTGIGVYDDLARFAGAGTLVPITGFANAVVSPALEFKAETLILGTSAKMFTIAGPVIVFGITASVIYGIILVIMQSF